MTTEIKVPVLPESVADATVATWHVQVGDKVSRDQVLVDIETDKVVLEVPAPADGVVTEISEEGATVLRRASYCYIRKVVQRSSCRCSCSRSASAAAPAAGGKDIDILSTCITRISS